MIEWSITLPSSNFVSTSNYTTLLLNHTSMICCLTATFQVSPVCLLSINKTGFWCSIWPACHLSVLDNHHHKLHFHQYISPLTINSWQIPCHTSSQYLKMMLIIILQSTLGYWTWSQLLTYMCFNYILCVHVFAVWQIVFIISVFFSTEQI